MAKTDAHAASSRRSWTTASTNFEKYVNPGILEYRKSCSTDYTAVEWRDEGNVFYDIHGKEFIDCLGGFGIYMLGHRHPTVVKARHGPARAPGPALAGAARPHARLRQRAARHAHAGRPAVHLLLQLRHRGQRGRAQARQAHGKRKKANHTNGIISCPRGFHGKSFGSPERDRQGGLARALLPARCPNVRFVPYGDADALDKELEVCDTIGLDIAAFIAEPVQGEAGAIVPPDDFFPKVREICDKWGILLIADEVQTGMGRTGKLWGIEHWGVAPDIMTMGKALGGAVIPVGCFIATPEVFERHVRTRTSTPRPSAATPWPRARHRRPPRDGGRGHPRPGGGEGRLAQGALRSCARSTRTCWRRSAAWACSSACSSGTPMSAFCFPN